MVQDFGAVLTLVKLVADDDKKCDTATKHVSDYA